jgi:TPP-dependent pyruvate/acetoin dehydrogenase alpha subunit
MKYNSNKTNMLLDDIIERIAKEAVSKFVLSEQQFQDIKKQIKEETIKERDKFFQPKTDQ